MSHAAAKPFHTFWRPNSEDTSKIILSAKKQPNNFASSNCDTIVGLDKLIHSLMQSKKKRGDKTQPY